MLSRSFRLPSRLIATLLGPAVILASTSAAEPKLEPKYPFRVGWANAHLPWYQPKPLEFPPHHSDQRVSGELVSADFILRKGQFRATKTGELMDFTMPPYGAINYLNAEADLREVPLGTFFLFFLNQDVPGGFTRLATMQDQFTMDAGHGFSYRLVEVNLGAGRLATIKRSIAKKQDDLGKQELLVTAETRVWRGEQLVKLEELKPGDDLLYNLTGKTADQPGRCTDIWIGADTHRRATEQQRKKFVEFTKKRGLPGWIEKTEANLLTVTLFSGDAAAFKQAYAGELVVGREVSVCVANDELRTWNPPVDKERGSIVEVQKVPTDGYGSSGVRLLVKVNNLLEGFRRGRVVRVFGPGWKVQDQLYGESLMGYGYGRLLNQELVENVAKEYPEQFPFRTDFGNAQLPWYQLKAGVKPPPFAEHRVLGELVSADAAARRGRFRADGTGAVVEFTLIPEGAVRHLNANATLADLAPGTRCRFHLFQDERGAFTRAALVSDEFSFLAGNAITFRLEALQLAAGKLHVARQQPEVKNYNGDMERPPDIGRAELRVTAETRVWRGERQLKLTDLARGDIVLVNLTGELPGQPSRCTDVWIGVETHKLVADQQGKKSKRGKR